MEEINKNVFEENQEEEKKKGRKRRILILLLLLLLLAFGGFKVYQNYVERISAVKSGSMGEIGRGIMPGMTPEEIQRYLNEKADKSKFVIDLNSHLEFDDANS